MTQAGEYGGQGINAKRLVLPSAAYLPALSKDVLCLDIDDSRRRDGWNKTPGALEAPALLCIHVEMWKHKRRNGENRFSINYKAHMHNSTPPEPLAINPARKTVAIVNL
jgi:hypothetical protein